MNTILAVSYDKFHQMYEERKESNWAFISIRNTDGTSYKFLPVSGNSLVTHFDDTQSNFDRGNLKPISDQQAIELFNFIEKNKTRNFLIHCTAGIYRSGAVAHFIHDWQTKHNKEYAVADEEFEANNPFILKNKLVYSKLVWAEELVRTKSL